MEDKEIIFGRNPVLEYLKSAPQGSRMELHLSRGAHGKIMDVIRDEARRKGVRIIDEDRQYFESMGGSSTHQGVVLRVLERKVESVSLEDLLSRTVAEKSVIVLLDQITDPHNAGSIIRSAEALGALGVVIPGAHSAGITPVVVKSSAGATAHIPVITVPNAAAFMDRAKDAGLWIIGTSDHATTSLSRIKEMKPAVVVIGSEGTGMRRLTEEKCDMTVRIPLKGKVSSLNASVAAGIVLYKILGDEE